MAEEGKGSMPQQQAKPKGMPPMKKPEGSGSAAKPRILTAPSLAKPTTSNETDMSKASVKGMALHPQKVKMNRESQRPGYIPERIKPGTIKKAISFVTKRMGG
jgi:hypothetical protein